MGALGSRACRDLSMRESLKKCSVRGLLMDLHCGAPSHSTKDSKRMANKRVQATLDRAPDPRRSGGHAARARQNAALTAFAAWFGYALRAAEPGSCTCRGGRQACGLPSPTQVSAAFGWIIGRAAQ
jgi:hypothetical protein